MPKLVFAGVLGLMVGMLTVMAALSQDVRPLTIVQRAVISSMIFGVIGYILASIAEAFLQRVAVPVKPKGQNIDIINKDELALDTVERQQEFRPFDPESLQTTAHKE
jgi:hypothetical protein